MVFSFQVIHDNLPQLLWAARLTFMVSVLGVGIGLALGALVCAARLSPLKPVRVASAVYISFFRGVPLLVQLLLFYYLLPVIGLNVPPMVAAVGTVGLCSAAYVAEYLRGAINAIPPGQLEAAVTLGFAPHRIWTRILLPQAVRISLPSLVNELILLVKASSLVSLVGITELTRTSQALASATYRPLEIFTMAAVVYLSINLCLALLGRYLERRSAV
ncbi:polar amino acid transport system permease protein [Ochrobactrum daejeonense]|uniref:Polar amino acid transport system permease protein n=1 Tax=Brucella daejeonensis TaxID=659015 RepID=A0A7W9B0A0_9HYPH|nr:amino acid ABC transporter permease [Brucella daejeonensis]MBB5703868.1 polar amino acid transport system permease protein [Brucella daejeonensis]